MRFFGGILLAFMVLEVISVVLMADWLGGGLTLLLLLAGFIGGALMLRHVGLAGMAVMGTTLRQGNHVSLYRLLWPIRYGVAALLLMSPGFVSDVFTLLLLFPFHGASVGAADEGHSFQRQNGDFCRYSRHQNPDDDIIEGDYAVREDSHSVKNLPSEHE